MLTRLLHDDSVDNLRKRLTNQKAELVVGATDSLNITTIFVMFLTEVMRRLLEETARFILFPIAAAAAIIKAGLAWRQAALENGKNGTTGRAIVETIAALAIGTAVVGSLLATATFAIISPIIFTATMGAKTLFHIGAAGYYWGKSAATPDPEKRAQYQAVARANVIGAVALTLATVAVGLVMLAAKPLMAVLGITAGTIGAAFSLYNLFKSDKASAVDEQPSSSVEAKKDLSQQESTLSAKLRRRFSRTPEPAPTAAAAAPSVAISPQNNATRFRLLFDNPGAAPASNAAALAPHLRRSHSLPNMSGR